MCDKHEVPELGKGFRAVLPNSVPLATLNDAEVVTDEWLRDLGGFSFAAPAGEGKLWSVHLEWYEGVKRLFPKEFFATRKGRETVLKSLKDFLLTITSPGNVGADGKRTNEGRPRSASGVLTEALRRKRRGLKGIKNYSDLHPQFATLAPAEQKTWYQDLKSQMRRRLRKRLPGRTIEVPVGKRRKRPAAPRAAPFAGRKSTRPKKS